MSSGGLSPLEQVRQIEEELRLHDRAMAASSCGITIADARQPDMPLIYINEAFEAITGYPTAEVLGKNCRFLQGEDRSQPELDEMRAALKGLRDKVMPVEAFPRQCHKHGGRDYFPRINHRLADHQ